MALETHAEQQATALKFLGLLWLQELDEESVQLFEDPEIAQAYVELGGVVPDASKRSLESLAVDYCQLLIGPLDPVSPVQSVAEQNQYQSSPTESMHRFFELIPNYEPPSSLVDHVGVQLDFAGALLLALANEKENRQGVFESYAQHHLAWIQSFLLRIKERSTTDFYRGLAEVTENILR